MLNGISLLTACVSRFMNGVSFQKQRTTSNVRNVFGSFLVKL